VAMLIKNPSEKIKKIYKVDECFGKWKKDIVMLQDLIQQIEKALPDNLEKGSSYSIKNWLKKNTNTLSNLPGVTWPELTDKNLTLKKLKHLVKAKVEDDNIYIFESDMATFDKRQGGGVQLVPLNWWLFDNEKYYGSRMYTVVRMLVSPNNQSKNFPELEEWLFSMAQTLYETKKADLMKSVMKANRTEDLSTVFCSELVAATFKKIGLLPDKTVSSNMLPRDFASGTYKSKLHVRHRGNDMKLENGAHLEKELRIFLNPLIRASDKEIQDDFEEREKDTTTSEEDLKDARDIEEKLLLEAQQEKTETTK